MTFSGLKISTCASGILSKESDKRGLRTRVIVTQVPAEFVSLSVCFLEARTHQTARILCSSRPTYIHTCIDIYGRYTSEITNHVCRPV